MENNSQYSFNFGDNLYLREHFIKKNVLSDRGSRYGIFAFPITHTDEIPGVLRGLKKDKYFQKATHNSYAFRILGDSGIIEGKNDDGEKGAGMCILRELTRVDAVNMVLGVTRHFGGIHLHGDRFANVIAVGKAFFDEDLFFRN